MWTRQGDRHSIWKPSFGGLGNVWDGGKQVQDIVLDESYMTLFSVLNLDVLAESYGLLKLPGTCM